MAEGGARALEQRLVIRLADIFPDHEVQTIRDAVYSALVALNGANVSEEEIIGRCIDGLLMPAPAPAPGLAMATPVNAPPAKRRIDDTPGSEEPKRLRPSQSDSSMETNSSAQSGGSGGNNGSVLDETIDFEEPVIDSEVQAMMRRRVEEAEALIRRRMETNRIVDMFPWIDPVWVGEQVAKPDYNMAHVIEHILTHQKDVPKKQKPKVAQKLDTASGTSNRSNTTAQAQPAAPKDYLNDYNVSQAHLSNYATQYLSSQFPQLYMESVRRILSLFNYHLPPAYKVLHDALKDREINRIDPITVTVKSGQHDVKVTLKFMKTRRTSRRSIAPALQDEVDFINRHFHGQGVEQKKTGPDGDINAVVDAGQQIEPSTISKRELQLERARERGDVYECGICIEECIMSEEMIQCADGHLFCIECLLRYAREAIYGQNKVDLFCMEESCEARFPRDMVEKALDEDSLKKLEEKRTFQELNLAEAEGLEKCRYCDYACIFDVPPAVNKVFKCGKPECEREYCRICFVDWEEHMGKPCKEVETEADTRARREAEEKMAAAVIRNCHKCKQPLIKTEGCNKLICSCGAMMCYLCRQSIKGYDHFCQHARDPASPGCKQCTRCSLWEDPNIKDGAAVKQIQDEVTKALAEAGKQLKVGVDEPPKPANPPPVMLAVGAPIFIRRPGIQPAVVRAQMGHVDQRIQNVVDRVVQELAVPNQGGNPIGPAQLYQQPQPAPVPPRQQPQVALAPPPGLGLQQARQQQAIVINAIQEIPAPIAQAANFRPDPQLAPHGGARPRVYNAPVAQAVHRPVAGPNPMPYGAQYVYQAPQPNAAQARYPVQQRGPVMDYRFVNNQRGQHD